MRRPIPAASRLRAWLQLRSRWTPHWVRLSLWPNAEWAIVGPCRCLETYHSKKEFIEAVLGVIGQRAEAAVTDLGRLRMSLSA
jgi:hypothetical protein